MASRNQYTSTPGYGNGRGQPQGGGQNAPRQAAPPRQQPMRQPQRRPAGRPKKDLLAFAAMLFVVPLLGFVGFFVPSFLWVFIIFSAIFLAALWVFRCFAQGTRAFASGVLLVFAIIALVAAIDLSPKQGDYPVYGGDNVAAQAQAQASGTSAAYHPAVAGLTSLSADPTAPIGGDTPPWESGDTGTDDPALQQDDPAGQNVNTALNTNESQMPVLGVTGDAQVALENYLTAWKNNDFEDMARYSTPSWKKAQKVVPQQQLYWNHNWWILDSWTVTSESGTASSDLASFKVVAQMRKNNSARNAVTQAYSALVINEDGAWYVDPDSVSSGVPVVDPTPAPDTADGEGGVAAVPTPTPEPEITSKTALWYNSKGGKRYHLEQQCPSIDEEYFSAMKKFTYGELGDKAYAKLTPCATCNAPARK